MDKIYVPICNDTEDLVLGIYSTLEAAKQRALGHAHTWMNNENPRPGDLAEHMKSYEYAILEIPVPTEHSAFKPNYDSWPKEWKIHDP